MEVCLKKNPLGNSTAVHELGLCAVTAKSSIPGQGAKIPQAEWPKEENKNSLGELQIKVNTDTVASFENSRTDNVIAQHNPQKCNQFDHVIRSPIPYYHIARNDKIV